MISEQCFDMVTEGSVDVGSVCVEVSNDVNGKDQLVIKYDTSSSGYCLTEVQAWAGTGDYPQEADGSPSTDNFPLKIDNISCL